MNSIYIAGPMTGIKNFNAVSFDYTAEKLKEAGWLVTNPMDFQRHRLPNLEGICDDIKSIIIIDVALLISCEAIWMLPGWQQSKGATAEYHLAIWAGLDIYENSTYTC
jgi:hypothetical protein